MRNTHDDATFIFQSSPPEGYVGLTGSYSKLIQQIQEVSYEGSFCEAALNSFSGDIFYDGIDRICLASRIGLSNQILVIDSKNKDPQTTQLMPPGYKCFVSPNSSLMEIKEKQVRIFHDVDKVINQFKNESKPVQRSVGYIDKMGFKSGLCLPVHINGQVRGFVFLNSNKPRYFSDLQYEDFFIFQLLGFQAQTRLLKKNICDPEIESLSERLELHWNAEFFDPEQFSKHFEKMNGVLIKNWHPEFVNQVSDRFIYSPFASKFAICLVHRELTLNDISIDQKIFVKKVDTESIIFEVTADSSSRSSALVGGMNQVGTRCQPLGIKISANVNKITLQVPADFNAFGYERPFSRL